MFSFGHVICTLLPLGAYGFQYWSYTMYNMYFLIYIICGCYKRHNWVKLIFLRMEYCRSSPKVSLFYSSSIQYIIGLNGTTPSESDLVKSPKPVYGSDINLVRYYKDKDGEYYCFYKDKSLIYEDMIMKPSVEGICSSSSGFISLVVKACLDELVGRNVANNQM